VSPEAGVVLGWFTFIARVVDASPWWSLLLWLSSGASAVIGNKATKRGIARKGLRKGSSTLRGSTMRLPLAAALVQDLRWRNPEPAVQLASTAVFLGWYLGRGGVHLVFKVGQQLRLVKADCRSILPKIAGTKDTAGQLAKFFGFNGAEEPQADFGALGDLFERQTRFLTCPRKVEAEGTRRTRS